MADGSSSPPPAMAGEPPAQPSPPGPAAADGAGTPTRAVAVNYDTQQLNWNAAHTKVRAGG
jgi:hypothetical protein